MVNFVSAKTVLAAVQADLGLTSEERRYDHMEWLFQCLHSLKAVPKYLTRVEELEVFDHKARLPCGVLEIEAVAHGGVALLEATDVGRNHYEQLEGLKDIWQRPANTYSVQDGWLYFKFKEGKVTLHYLTYKMDSDGYPMIPDDSDFYEAVVNYIIWKSLQAGVLHRRTSPNEVEYYFKQYRYHKKAAQVNLNFPTPQKMVAISRGIFRLFPDVLSTEKRGRTDANLETFTH